MAAARSARAFAAAITVAAAVAVNGWMSGAADAPDPAATAAAVTPETPPGPAAGDVIDRWLQRQAAVRTWSALFVQTRSLKTLAQPLVAHGRVRFAAPNRFHWELGDPVQTLAVRQSNAVLIVYPPLRRAERYPLEAASAGPWKQMLSLLEVGFPESRAQLDARFRVLSRTTVGDTHELTLEPRTAAVRRLMPRFRIFLGEPDLGVRATEMVFADGSSLRNDFRGVEVNPVLDERLFEPELGADFKVTEPLARPRP